MSVLHTVCTVIPLYYWTGRSNNWFQINLYDLVKSKLLTLFIHFML